MDNLLQVGAILDTHGLRGEVKVFPTTDDPSRYDDLEEVELLTKEGKYIHLEVERVRYFKNLVIVKFKHYDNINDIEQYKKCNLYVTRENAVELEEDDANPRSFFVPFVQPNSSCVGNVIEEL